MELVTHEAAQLGYVVTMVATKCQSRCTVEACRSQQEVRYSSRGRRLHQAFTQTLYFHLQRIITRNKQAFSESGEVALAVAYCPELL